MEGLTLISCGISAYFYDSLSHHRISDWLSVDVSSNSDLLSETRTVASP